MNAIAMLMNPPRVTRPAVAARLTLLFAAAFVALLTIVHLVTPQLDPAMRPISEYALGPHGWLMTLAFLMWGATAASLVAALQPHVRTRAGRIGLAFLLIGAAGPLLAAIFPMDAMGAPVPAATTSGNVHSVAAMLGDGIPIGALLLCLSLTRSNPAWTAVKWPLIITTALVWTAVVAMTAMLASTLSGTGGEFVPNTAVGWPARLMVLTYVLWMVVTARYAIEFEQAAERSPK